MRSGEESCAVASSPKTPAPSLEDQHFAEKLLTIMSDTFLHFKEKGENAAKRHPYPCLTSFPIRASSSWISIQIPASSSSAPNAPAITSATCRIHPRASLKPAELNPSDGRASNQQNRIDPSERQAS